MAIHLARTSADVTRAVYNIFLKVDPAAYQTLGELRKICGGIEPTEGNTKGITHIPFYVRLPASGLDFYKEMLSNLSRQNKPFALNIMAPRFTPHAGKQGVGLGLSSTAQTKLVSDIATALKDAHIPGRHRSLNLKLHMASHLTQEDAETILKIARENYEKGPRSVSILGLSMRHDLVTFRAGQAPEKGRRIGPSSSWEDFLFHGVDEEEKHV